MWNTGFASTSWFIEGRLEASYPALYLAETCEETAAFRNHSRCARVIEGIFCKAANDHLHVGVDGVNGPQREERCIGQGPK